MKNSKSMQGNSVISYNFFGFVRFSEHSNRLCYPLRLNSTRKLNALNRKIYLSRSATPLDYAHPRSLVKFKVITFNFFSLQKKKSFYFNSFSRLCRDNYGYIHFFEPMLKKGEFFHCCCCDHAMLLQI